uniref:YitH/HolE acetyltransferase (GNAT) domain-containing protein n=1 Tax=Tetranychus urticae TaxID=32264 RepID=T1KSU6_TETUR
MIFVTLSIGFSDYKGFQFDLFIGFKRFAGFRVEDKIKILEYEGSQLKTEDLVSKISNIEIKKIVDDDILQQKVFNYDSSVVYFDRSSLLKLTFAELDTLALVAIDKDNNSIVGYGCIRTNNINRAMAGPIYANNDGVAELLVYNLLVNFPISLTAGLDFMTPDCNPGGLRIAAKLGLKKNEDLPRLFRKSVPKVDWNRVYNIHTPNFSPY